MAVDHEAPYLALANRLQRYCRDYLAKPVSRRIMSYDAPGIAEHPCMFVLATTQAPQSDGPAPASWLFEAEVVIYARADADPGSSTEPVLNKIVGAVEAALERQIDEDAFSPGQMIQHWTTLSGAVLWAKPTEVRIVDGAQADEGIAIVGVEMLVRPV